VSAETEAWVDEYVRLRRVQLDLREFVRARSVIIAQIAQAHAEASEEPCRYCKVQVTSLIDSGRWYFEWECEGHMYPQGRCSADTCGWDVPLDVVHRELEAALAAAART
jgi:hypothetical protein